MGNTNFRVVVTDRRLGDLHGGHLVTGDMPVRFYSLGWDGYKCSFCYSSLSWKFTSVHSFLWTIKM